MIKVVLNTKEFDRSLFEYRKFSKKLLPEIINTKLYFIARNATMTTPKSSKDKIQRELMSASNINPKAPLAAILVNSKLGKEGTKGLYGSRMTAAINRLIRARNKSIGFVRSGWKNAIGKLQIILKASGSLRGVPKMDTTINRKTIPDSFGSARPAVEMGTRTSGEINNAVSSKGDTSTLDAIKMDGLQEAVNLETQSMNEYIEKKLNEEHNKRK